MFAPALFTPQLFTPALFPPGFLASDLLAGDIRIELEAFSNIALNSVSEFAFEHNGVLFMMPAHNNEIKIDDFNGSFVFYRKSLPS